MTKIISHYLMIYIDLLSVIGNISKLKLQSYYIHRDEL